MTKLSIHSASFLNPVHLALQEGKSLVVWHQIPWSGGAQEWYLIRHSAALIAVLDHGRVASAFTIDEWFELPDCTQAGQEA
jgi:hypothetical protein